MGFGDFSAPFVFLKWEHQGGKRRKSQQIGSSEQDTGRWLEAPRTAGPLLSGKRGGRGWGVARAGPGSRNPPQWGWKPHKRLFVTLPGDLGRPVSCNTHTPTGLRAVRLVPKANTELIFPAYSFHVWAASGFAGSLGSLLLALPKHPSSPLRLAGSWLLSSLHPSPNTVFRFT